MQEKILEYLSNKDDYVSGDAISARLGISRQALWKHIQELRDAGYDIVAVPHLGYRLKEAPDRLFEFEVTRNLGTKFVGKKIYYFDSVASTMNEALKLGITGAQEGTLVLAETQTKGKGRLGRVWFSPKYKGIYMSLILRPKIPPSEASILTLLSAVSVCEAVKKICAVDAQIKWPNDILIGNKKLGGILTELNAETDRVGFISIGIGLNVNNDKKNLILGTTSLKEHKKEGISRIELLRELLRQLEADYLLFQHKGPASIIARWREYSTTLGRRVKVYTHSKHYEGQALDIESDGSLIIRNDSGLNIKITAGDVMHCR
ncbi:MAG: biotin--[acetyl-CoA-carboxylase] ligase [Candidatus Omnitrophota bacterium]|jgi:BirA family biotin operon repressor/biotin-[acetyl-CoA-carboxylase] ligase